MNKKSLTVNQFFMVYGASLAAVVLIFLGVTGRLNPLIALLGALLPLIARWSPWLMKSAQAFGLFKKMRTPPPATTNGTMSAKEACEILDIDVNASKEEIIAAHRKLMQKMHPDHGGSTYLAARINEAKEFLLRS